MIRSPVLFLVFNRPVLTALVFAAIQEAKPPRLYIAADGPREECPNDREWCEQVRRIVTKVDWPCEVRTLFRDRNLGCRIGVSTGIDWFFENEPEGILIEDDCLPDLSFFKFCEELLHRYREEPRVMVISGNYFQEKPHKSGHSYYFSRYAFCWGWASWRRAWQCYDREMIKWPALSKTDWLRVIGDGSREFEKYWTRIFNDSYEGKLNTWDYQWIFSCWVQGGLSIHPLKNIVTNIGFGENGTHTRGQGDWRSKMPLDSMSFPLNHPDQISRDKNADRWTDFYVFKSLSPMYKKVLRKIPGFRMATSMIRHIR